MKTSKEIDMENGIKDSLILNKNSDDSFMNETNKSSSLIKDQKIDIDKNNKNNNTENESNIKNKDEIKKGFFKLYFRILGYSFRYKCLFFLANFGVLITSFTESSIPYICGKLMDAMNKTNSDELYNLCYNFIILALASGFFGFIKNYCYEILSSRIIRDLRSILFEKILHKDVEFFDSNKTGDLISRLSSDITVINESANQNFSTILKNSIVFIFSLGILFFLNTKLTIYIFLVVPPLVLSVLFFIKYFQKYSKLFQDSIADASGLATEIFGNIRVVKSFSTENHENEKYKEKINFSYTIAYKKALMNAILGFLITIFAYLAILFVLWIGGLEVLGKKMTSGELSSFLIYTLSLSTSVISFSAVNQMVSAAAVSEKIFKLIDEKNKINEKKLYFDEATNEVYEECQETTIQNKNKENKLNSIPDNQKYVVDIVHLSNKFNGKKNDSEFYSIANSVNMEDSLNLNRKDSKYESIIGLRVEESILISNEDEKQEEKKSNKIYYNNGIIKNINGNINLRNVSFSYPSKPDVEILVNLNLSINSGEKLAIVGSSGSGKSTILSLLERFYDCTKGEILFDEINIKHFNIQNLHQQIGFVSQEPTLFSGTIKENLIYGLHKSNNSDFIINPETSLKINLNSSDNKNENSITIQDEELKHKMNNALKLANADGFINDEKKFPLGLETLVGERGVQLSGGQKQRIAIARAIIKNPKILIFDEATSALDSESEFQVQQAISMLMETGKMTIIIIAHRLSTIINCDRILVMKNGVIVEEGTHKQLIDLNGYYKTLVENQISSFFDDKQN